MSTEEKRQEVIEQQEEETFVKLSQLFIKLEEISKIEIRNATYGHSRSDYVRGKDLEKALTNNIEMLSKDVNQICNTNIDPKSPSALQLVYKEFHRRGILSKALRPETEGKAKYPKKLIPLEHIDECCDDQHDLKNSKIDFKVFESSFFYAIDVVRSKRKTYFWLFMAIFGVIMACLFPVWPIEVKIGIWWVSYILLIALVVIIIVRYTIYTFFYIFGISLWIFPNLFDDSKGVIDSFLPLYSVEKRQDSFISILIRLAITGIVGYTGWYIYSNPDSIYDFRDHLVEIYSDMFEFGKDKIVNYYVSLVQFIN